MMRIVMIILWLLFGSLGSVILTRFADGVTRKNLRGFFFWRSKCPHCKHTLWISDLIPLFSYLFHGGKCRYCGAKLSWIYPILELLSAGIFLWTYLWMGEHSRGIIIFWLLTNWLLLLLIIYDIQRYELHMPIRIGLVTLGILGNFLMPWAHLLYALFASILFVGGFLLIYLLAQLYVKIKYKQQWEGFGEGDVYLALIIGLYIPIILPMNNLAFSRPILFQSFLLILIMSSIFWLIYAWIVYSIGKHITIWKKIDHPIFWIWNSAHTIIPFFPAIILALRLFTWQAERFITLLFG